MKNSLSIACVWLLLLFIPISSHAESASAPSASFGQSHYFVLNTNSIGFGQCLSIVLPANHHGDGGSLPALGTLAPNPFNPTITIAFHLESNTVVELSIFDLSGRLVNHLITREFTAGQNTWQWDGRSGSGAALPAGVYLVKMINPKNTDTKKITLVK